MLYYPILLPAVFVLGVFGSLDARHYSRDMSSPDGSRVASGWV